MAAVNNSDELISVPTRTEIDAEDILKRKEEKSVRRICIIVLALQMIIITTILSFVAGMLIREFYFENENPADSIHEPLFDSRIRVTDNPTPVDSTTPASMLEASTNDVNVEYIHDTVYFIQETTCYQYEQMTESDFVDFVQYIFAAATSIQIEYHEASANLLGNSSCDRINFIQSITFL